MQETIALGNACHSLEFPNSKIWLTVPRGLKQYFRYIDLQSQTDPQTNEFSTEAVHGLSVGSNLGKTLLNLGKTQGKPWGKLRLLLRKKNSDFTQIGHNSREVF
ncbi:hypothetical protein [Leptothoe sp. PORK10 BA2]|uniref:hypothetical protein n=1 Tax=Leptothoe sp. PORK10 BA2 TaxID=3110254 RepID=UPI002B2065D3|nr:hypothetical protein [Leptothoe sp. PORK10 BA2]MEA5465599.1 hypothetical protein [Leptothoe sp. PORK10 BA2]